jgi:hypothetical protein
MLAQDEDHAYRSQAPEMHEGAKVADFSLLGGPLHRIGCRLGLIRGGTDSLPFGLAIAGFLWTVALVLTLIERTSAQFFSLAAIGGHVRLLVAIPLFFATEAGLDASMATFVHGLVRTKIVPKASLADLQSAIARSSRWRDSWLPEVVCLLLAVLQSSSALPLPYIPEFAGADTLVGKWYAIVCLTTVRFLILRWVWRVILWCHFLWRLARLDLHLVPIHPDGTAGLGYLEIVHTRFLPLVFAMSAIIAASFATDLLAGKMTFEALYLAIPAILAIDAVVYLGPLLIVLPQLAACRRQAMKDYMEFATGYVNDFDQKWLGGSAPKQVLLGTPDLQSLADLANSVNIARNMQSIPVSKRLVMTLLVAALVPMVPLLFLKYPIAELIVAIVKKLSGL